MNFRQIRIGFSRGEELVATFGQARLVRHLDGTCDLVGGTDLDRAEAQDWLSLFMHEVVLRRRPSARVLSVAQPDWRARRGDADFTGRQ